MENFETLRPDYFEKVYAANEDPWDFETSAYEAEKYAATITALPKDKYKNALEIGCSIGVLTELLAKKCEKLLSIDVSL
ncbi:SAM-dependent methyltransferase [Frigoriflavimonas asaccharolytica]|uniref:Protein-L-isoaspartate O-methyltransferase n=1 Tax=Frigoriflavimonas asaccharolytica TaxID=2735899 RepID=A0A8J8K9Y7_9FLAO|nr:SAM-dependent methyltransferase [Frigoriflavimonas asaccharolytica]NRS94156.1 protein-L-isoaspartate O-methyltransferase [Frigoriflavimonas asaccharolytica]